MELESGEQENLANEALLIVECLLYLSIQAEALVTLSVVSSIVSLLCYDRHQKRVADGKACSCSCR